MSVPNQTPYIIYNANGLTTVFPFEFYIISASDIQVSTNGVRVTSGFTVSGVGNVGGGNITFLTPPVNGTVVMLERVVPTFRLTDYQDNGDLLADTVNKDFDRLWMAIQRSFIYLGLALRRPLLGGPFNAESYRIADLADPVDNQDAATKKFVIDQTNISLARVLRVPENSVPVIPGISARKNKLLAFNNDGNPIVVLPESGSAADVMLELGSSENGKGDEFIAVKQPFTGSVPGTQHAKNMEHLSVMDFGAVGNGVADDSSAVNNALAQRVFSVLTRNDGKYLVPSLNNPLGTQIIGKGQLLKNVTGGQEMQNSYVDAYQRMTGQENLAAWFSILMLGGSSPKIVFSGDSTTAGDGTSAKFKIDLLVKERIRQRGLQTTFGINAVNKGHSGASTGAWNSTYVTEDIAENAALYVVRWGINDVKDVNTFATNLREGLTKYRAARPFATNSILLMMPNSTYDIPNGRDAKWYEQLYNVYVQAARDFKCAFLDTYAITQNSKGLAGLLMDNPYGDGRGIHPNDTLNSIIAGYIVDTIVPEGLTTVYGTTRLANYAGAEDATINASRPPAEFSEMISIIRALPSNGWAIDGNAITFRTMDGTLLQFIFGYKDADRGTMFVRMGRAATLGGESATWSPSYQVANRFQSADIVTTGVYSPGTSKCNRTGTQVIVDGKMTTSTPTNINAGTTIGTVPAGYRPTRDVMYGTATMVNSAGTSFLQVPVNVQTNGAISVAGAATSVSYIYLNISYDIQ